MAVRSRRQAMEWSLVLVSQGIETSISQPAEDGAGWTLLVDAADYERALKALRQYHLENRGWPWRQPLRWPETKFDWVSLAWAGLLIGFHWFGAGRPGLRDAGILDSAAVYSGQWWRIFTAMILHADLAHLAGNLSIGVLLFGLAMGRFGTGTGALAIFLAGAGGNCASLAIHDKSLHGLGASGMVMGALGLLAAQSLHPMGHNGGSWKGRWSGLAAGLMLFALYGLAPGTDIAAHFGGLMTGLGIGAVLVYLPVWFCRSAKINFANGMILVVLIVTTWWLALTNLNINRNL